MILRPATPQDAREVAHLWNDMIRDTLATFTTQEWTHADMVAHIVARRDAFWLAEGPSGAPLGFVTYGPFRSGPGYAATVEHTIIIGKSAQRSGVGTRLMAMAATGAAAAGHRIMVAAISSANPDAVRFHGRLGFEQTGHMRQVGYKAGRCLDLILMQKTVSAS